MLVVLIILVVITGGYLNALYRLRNQDINWEYEHDREFELKRLWKERGYMKTPWGINQLKSN